MAKLTTPAWVIGWLAKRMDEEPAWCKALMYLMLAYFVFRELVVQSIRLVLNLAI